MLQGEHSAILSTFIKLPFVIKIFVSSIFEWQFYTGFTVSSFHISDFQAYYLHTQKMIFILFCMFLYIKVRKVKERKKKKKKKVLGQKEQWMKLLPHSEVSPDLDSKYRDIGGSRGGGGGTGGPDPP